MPIDIFGKQYELPGKKIQENSINGLTYQENWITDEEQIHLLSVIDGLPWLSTLKRRVQHYGYIYDYRTAKSFIASNKDNYIGELPDFLMSLSQRLKNENFFKEIPDQVIINEYLPGQGIANHIDCIPCFGDTVVSLSLGSQCVMDFKHPKKETIFKVLNPKSIVCIKDESRYEWSHGIRQNITDIIGGKRIERNRRVSITFRNIIK